MVSHLKRTFFLVVSSLFFSSCYYTEEADILIHNAKIYTVNQSFDKEEAMAIRDGKIIEIGPDNELKNRYTAKETIDAKLQYIYPGFIDAHCHFLWYGNTFFEVDLVGTKSWEEALNKTIEFAKSNEDLWIKGRGWDQNDWAVKEFPTKKELDSIFPDRAVILRRIDGHAAIVNQKALELANITSNSVVKGGEYRKNNGNLTGLILDNAIDTIAKVIPELSEVQMRRALLKAQEMCFEQGLTTVDDAMLEKDMALMIDKMQKSNELKMKVYGMLLPTKENQEYFLKNGPYLTDKLSIRAFKYFADGALGSRGAKLIEPYSDDIHNSGMFLNDSSYFNKEAKKCFENGYQMNSHCIGDAANRMMLNIYASYLKGTNDLRWRIEHAQIVQPTDLKKFSENTIIPSVQPTHATSDMYWLEDRVGEKRAKLAYAYKDLLSENGIIALGTDFPIEDISTMKTFYAAVARKDSKEYPKEGFQKENALSREEALRGMTIWAAIANFEDSTKGSLEIGKSADFIILNQDIINVKEEKLLNTKVIGTYVNGEKVFGN